MLFGVEVDATWIAAFASGAAVVIAAISGAWVKHQAGKLTETQLLLSEYRGWMNSSQNRIEVLEGEVRKNIAEAATLRERVRALKDELERAEARLAKFVNGREDAESGGGSSGSSGSSAPAGG